MCISLDEAVSQLQYDRRGIEVTDAETKTKVIDGEKVPCHYLSTHNGKLFIVHGRTGARHIESAFNRLYKSS